MGTLRWETFNFLAVFYPSIFEPPVRRRASFPLCQVGSVRGYSVCHTRDYFFEGGPEEACFF